MVAPPPPPMLHILVLAVALGLSHVAHVHESSYVSRLVFWRFPLKWRCSSLCRGAFMVIALVVKFVVAFRTATPVSM